MSATLQVITLLSIAGCAGMEIEQHGEPQRPGALGTITASAGVNLAAYRSLELRFAPTTSDPDGALEMDRRSVALASNELPFTYSIGGDLGINQWPQWRVTTWLTDADPSDVPRDGEPRATAALSFSCTDGCPQQSGINLVLQ